VKRIIILFAGVLLSCSFSTVSWSGTYQVAVSQFVEHPALDAARKGFMNYLEEAGVSAQYTVYIDDGSESENLKIADQIAAEEPDLILTISTPSSQACAERIKGKPILFTAVTAPVEAGLVKSLTAPGANITGTTDMSPIDRHIALMKEIHPSMKTLGLIYNPQESNSVTLLKLLKRECAACGIAVEEAQAASSEGVEEAARAIVNGCDAVYVPGDNTVVSRIECVARACRDQRIPLYAGDLDSVPRGAIAALAIDYYRLGRQTGAMAARIFNGSDPSAMPVECQRELRLHVNVKAAANMGVELPVDLILAADAVFESFPQ